MKKQLIVLFFLYSDMVANTRQMSNKLLHKVFWSHLHQQGSDQNRKWNKVIFVFLATASASDKDDVDKTEGNYSTK